MFVLQSVSSLLLCISSQWVVCFCVSHPSGCLLVCISPQWVVCLYLTPVGVLVCISPMQVMSVTACSCCWWRHCFQQSHAGTMSCIMGLFGWPPPSIPLPFPPPTPSVFCLCQYTGMQHSFVLCAVCIYILLFGNDSYSSSLFFSLRLFF